MATAELLPVYTHLLDYLVEKATPQEILAFELPETEQKRLQTLAEKQAKNLLTPGEMDELQQRRELQVFVKALKSRAWQAIEETDYPEGDIAEEFRRGWREAMRGETLPVSELWDDIDAE